MRNRTKSDRRTLTSSLSGDVLRWLTERGYSQVEVAILLGVSESFISLVKSRERSFTLDHLESLCTSMRIPMGALLMQVTRKECKTPEEKALVEATDRLLLKADALEEVLRRHIAAQEMVKGSGA